VEAPTMPPDPRARKQAIVLATLLGIAGLALLLVVRRETAQINKLARDQRAAAVQRAQRLVIGVACCGVVGFVGMGVWFWRLGRRIRRADQFPPPGMKVVRETPIRTGAAAWRIAGVADFAALLSLIGAAALGYFGWVAVEMIE